ncbi:uncharacterized protein LOC133415298 [Phycodurus eques]|uniref:uncharacterized protein LOC133415298 n=1 Tax=Phycodurus eques TaxID=693459 RepID=UPI002ACDB4D2|nr:uncharacterized protein LOC133415298 [Phycodurus eques]
MTPQSSASPKTIDESAYRQEAERPELRCGRRGPELNTLETAELIEDFRRRPSPQLLSSCLVSTVGTFESLGITVSREPKRAIDVNSVLKKAQRRMYFLRRLRKHGLPRELLRRFYAALIESGPCSSITVWFGDKLLSDPPHPGHRLFRLLPSARRYRTMQTTTGRHSISYFPLAINVFTAHLQFDCNMLPILCLEFVVTSLWGQ